MPATPTEIPNIRIRKGIPLPEKQKPETRRVPEILAGLKKGESFLVAPEHRNRVLLAANYLRRKGSIPFRILSRTVVEGGVEAVCIWRVEEQ